MPDCLFCKIADHTIAVKTIHEDDQSVAFADIAPQAPTHLLVVPRQHFATIADAPAKLLGHLFETAAALAERELPQGYRMVVNTGPDGGQTVDHLHIHLLGGRPMTWPPG